MEKFVNSPAEAYQVHSYMSRLMEGYCTNCNILLHFSIFQFYSFCSTSKEYYFVSSLHSFKKVLKTFKERMEKFVYIYKQHYSGSDG